MIKVSPSWACWCQKKNIVLLNHLITRLVLNIRLLWLSIHITLDHLEFSLVHLPASNPGGCCCPLHYWAPGGDFSYGRHSFSCGCCVLRGWNRVGARKCLFIHHPRAGRTSRNPLPPPLVRRSLQPLCTKTSVCRIAAYATHIAHCITAGCNVSHVVCFPTWSPWNRDRDLCMLSS